MSARETGERSCAIFTREDLNRFRCPLCGETRGYAVPAGLVSEIDLVRLETAASRRWILEEKYSSQRREGRKDVAES